MKKILLLITTVIVVLLSSCSDDIEVSNNNDATGDWTYYSTEHYDCYCNDTFFYEGTYSKEQTDTMNIDTVFDVRVYSDSTEIAHFYNNNEIATNKNGKEFIITYGDNQMFIYDTIEGDTIIFENFIVTNTTLTYDFDRERYYYGR